ncbi:STAS domain-containing protein [Streptomyces sp. NPDC057062]|uniref:STAS domain-containing protein n=1 Tax=Streptomyces sp. NPDC057062 TaxID=3346011 RepID=UPI00363C577A
MSTGRPAGLPTVDAETPAVLVVAGPVTRDDVARLGEEMRALMKDTGAAVVVCDVAALRPVTLASVDVLARLQLAVRRAGGRIRLRDPAPALRALLALVGLPFEMEGDVEQRKPALGVEEEMEPGEPAV